jgi:flagellar hook protein FlgE
MISAFAYGIAGLRAAEMRVSARAQNIVNWQSQNYRPIVPHQTTGASNEPVVKITRAELSGDFPFVDLENEIVDMQMAKRAYQASAKVIRTADEMSKTLLDALA